MRVATLAVLGAILASPATGLATLGEPHGSVDADRRALGGEPRPVTADSRYTTESFDLHGTTVREFVRPDGQVFAVAWEGLTHPDLATLLGSHAGAWRAALAAAPLPASRAHRRVVAGTLVVETWGHMRHLLGRAISSDLLPPEVGEDEIR
jgi:hypothetical protein